MRPWLITLFFLSLWTSCRKTETVDPAPLKETLYPHVDRFAGTFHISHEFSYDIPFLYDSTYQQVVEVVYPDSNWVAFNLSFPDVQGANGKYSPYLVTRSVSFLKRADNHYTFDSGQQYVSHVTVLGDSLSMDRYYRHSLDEILTVNFVGKRI